MAVALDQFEVEGVGNNMPFLSAVMEQERFREGRLTTGYIAEEFPEGFAGAELDDDTLLALRGAGLPRGLSARDARVRARPATAPCSTMSPSAAVVIGEQALGFLHPEAAANPLC